MTSGAANLEDIARWLGVVIAFIGALVANPDATAHGLASVRDWLSHTGHQVRSRLAKYIPRLRKSAVLHAVTATSRMGLSGVAFVSRGIVGWGPDAMAERKFEILDERTRALDKEVGDLQGKLRQTEESLRSECSESVNAARREVAEVRASVAELQREMARADASALPIIVVGIALSGLSSDASEFPVWFVSLVLVLASGLAAWLTLRIVLQWRAAKRAQVNLAR